MTKGLDLGKASEDDVKAEIRRLEEALEKGMLWPKKFDIYVHRDKEENWSDGDALGLTEEAISNNFRGCCYEVKISLEVHQDGTAYATHFGGVELKEKVEV